jgi:hypothetical protein
MFSKLSRYRRLPDVVTVDADGRALASKALRLLPDAPGDVLHTVEDGDRLDHLAFKYYNQSRDWWRIADANPDVLSPFALLGNAPHVTVRIPVSWTGPTPPWGDLLRALRDTLGVEWAGMGPAEAGPYVQRYLEGTLAFTNTGTALVTALENHASYQRTDGAVGALLEPAALTNALEAALTTEGIVLGGAITLATAELTRWRVVEEGTGRVFTFVLDEAESRLDVFEGGLAFDWVVTVVVNTLDTTVGALLDLIETEVFDGGSFADPGVAAEVGRVGKPIVVPPRRSRA